MRRETLAVLACALAWSAGAADTSSAETAADAKLRANRDTYHPVMDLLTA